MGQKLWCKSALCSAKFVMKQHANHVILLSNMIFISPMLSNLLLVDWLIDDVVPEDVNDVE